MNPLRLAIVSTHPIQYYAPVFRALAGDPRIELRVFYTFSQAAQGPIADAGFGRQIEWDIPLLDGYDSQFVPNIARAPGTTHFRGICNPDLPSRIAAWGAAALLVYGWNHQSHLAALRRFKGRIAVFFRGDSTLLNEQTPLRKLARRQFLRWIYRHVDVPIAVGSNNRDYYTWCGVPRERIGFAPHSVDTHRFMDATGEHAAQASRLRERLGIPSDARVLVFAAKFIPDKDPLLLLEAFIRAAGDAHLVLVGNGALEEQMRRRAHDHANIHFLPFQNQSAMPAVYRLGDVFLLPSRSETWGLALNEAMASGRAVVAGSRVGATRDLIRHRVNGWSFESGNGGELTQVVREVVAADRRALATMGEQSTRAIEAWSTPAAARGIADTVTAFA
jgi:glycosyltransferase involved in cell wall biosynthesis